MVITYSDLSYIFSGVKAPKPQDLLPVSLLHGLRDSSKMGAAKIRRRTMWPIWENACRCVFLPFVDDKKDRGAVGRTLHAVLYTLLIHYRLSEAVRLVELVLRLRDVRQLTSVYQMPTSSAAAILSSHCQV